MNGYFRVKAFFVSDDVRLTSRFGPVLRSACMGVWGATAFGRKSVRIASLLVAVCIIAVGRRGDRRTRSADGGSATVLRDATRTLFRRRSPRRYGGRRDLGRPGVSRAKDAAGVGSRDVPASTLGSTR